MLNGNEAKELKDDLVDKPSGEEMPRNVMLSGYAPLAREHEGGIVTEPVDDVIPNALEQLEVAFLDYHFMVVADRFEDFSEGPR